MVPGLNRAGASTALRTLAWTAVLCLALFAVDRWALGPPRPPAGTWVVVNDIAAVPGPAGNVVVPPYLPATISWPPAKLFHQALAPFSWWLGLRPVDGGPVDLWIGVGAEAPPKAMGDAAACVVEGRDCPPAWHALSTALRDGRLAWVVGRLEPEEVERIADALARSHGRR